MSATATTPSMMPTANNLEATQHHFRPWAICTIARSGSTWLCDLVHSTGVLGSPMEYLLNLQAWCRQFGLPEQTRMEDYLTCLMQHTSTPNGLFGIKGSLEQLRPFFEYFGDVPCVWLRRSNQIEQAISWYRASQTGLWHVHGSRPAEKSAAFDRDHILRFLKIIEEREAEWISWFSDNGIMPMEVFYEQAVDHPLETVRKIAEHVGVGSDRIERVSTTHRIMRDETTARWLRQLAVEG